MASIDGARGPGFGSRLRVSSCRRATHAQAIVERQIAFDCFDFARVDATPHGLSEYMGK